MINIFSIGLLLAPGWLAVPSDAFDDYKINLINNADRTLDLSDLGVNLTSTFNQLLSPEGIVNQFSLSIIIQIFFIVGYVVSGFILAALKTRFTDGPILDFLQYFDIHLSAQAIVDTVARSLLSLLWELISRVTTTFMLFGIFESVTQILNSTSLLSIWSFLSSSTLKEVMLVRFVMATGFVALQYPLLVASGPAVSELLGGAV